MKSEMIGEKFGRLTVIDLAGKRGRNIYVTCRCECGSVRDLYVGNLRAGRSTSCGCYNAELSRSRRTTHGWSKSTEYAIWTGMRQRCNDAGNRAYANYGGRGIKVCDRWNESFENFLADMGICPEGMSIDRIENDSDYMPGNCKWATKKEQANNRRSCLKFSHNGKTQTLTQWTAEYGVAYHVAIQRIKKLGWSFERAITTKVATKTHKTINPQATA